MLDTSTAPPTWWVTGDGRVDIADAVVLLRQSVGFQDVRWRDGSCGVLPGDVAPGLRSPLSSPPLWTPLGDGRRDIGDVLVLLRLTVGLERLDDTLTYWRDAKRVIDDRCASCHLSGGLAPFPLTTYAEVLPEVPALRPAIANRVMPPWPPSPACNAYLHSRALGDAQREMLLSWIDTGAREGDPVDEPPPIVREPGIDYDLHLPMAEPYSPDPGASDDYRCFVLDWPLTATSYVTGFQIKPDRRDMVHHVIAFAIAPSGVDAVRRNDARDAGPGYSCFGGPGAPDGTARWVGAWVPGTEGGGFPAGTGIRVPPGSVLVMQVHYNIDNATPGPDQSVMDFRTTGAVDRPAVVLLQAQQSFRLAAGDPAASAQELTSASDLLGAGRYEIGGAAGDPIVLWSAGLHMHQLGTSADFAVVPATGAETCLLDIPAWDFHWQGGYELKVPVTVQMADTFRLRCRWDNSADNQAWVGGVQQAPAVVQRGEGTRDEMCLAVTYATTPCGSTSPAAPARARESAG